MQSDNPEYQIKVYQNLIRVYNQDLLPRDHVNFLLELRDKYNFYPKVCYDIGAAVLHWTRHASKIWDTSIYLFDAFSPAEILYGDYKYHIGVLSDKDDKYIKYYQNDFLFGGNSYYREKAINNVAYFAEDNYLIKKTYTLDSIIKNNNYEYPDLIKIDVQGAELDILKGATEVLKNAKCLIVELQCVEYNEGAPTVETTKPYLESIGWKCIAEKFSDNGPDADYCFINTNTF